LKKICLSQGTGTCERDPTAALALYRRAAELGDPKAQHAYGELAYGGDDWQRYRWWGKAFSRGNVMASQSLLHSVVPLLQRLPESSRLVFELGEAFEGRLGDRDRGSREQYIAAQRCVQRYQKWCAEAQSGIRCWLIVGKRLGVARDMRVLIARLVWEERAKWSKRAGQIASNRQLPGEQASGTPNALADGR
jgi:hypothetical protein